LSLPGEPRITITSIAQEAGVSIPTVSRVINGRSDVAPDTRRRIEELLERRGYRRPSARPRESTGLIDLVFNDLDSPWAVEIIRGVEDAASSFQLSAVISAVHHPPSSARQWVRGLKDRGTDGVVLVTSDVASPLHRELNRLGIPTVVIDPAGVSAHEGPAIGAANWSGGLAATEHLISLGHRRIAFIAGPRHLLSTRTRLDGYRSALGVAGIPVDDDMIRDGDFSHESGFACGNALLDLDKAPTAVFTASDQTALGVYEAARQRGMRIPDHLSVIGFDDLPEARWSSPPLTTVRLPLSEMGMLAARTVLRLAQGEEVDGMRLELATILVVRKSTAAR
jgi:LacI family transcriptional regulator